MLEHKPAAPSIPEPEPDRSLEAGAPEPNSGEQAATGAGDAGEPPAMTSADIREAQELRARNALRIKIETELDALKDRAPEGYAIHIRMEKTALMKGAVDESGKPIIDEEAGKQKQVPRYRDGHGQEVRHRRGGGHRGTSVGLHEGEESGRERCSSPRPSRETSACR